MKRFTKTSQLVAERPDVNADSISPRLKLLIVTISSPFLVLEWADSFFSLLMLHDVSMFVRSDVSQGLASIKIKRAYAKVWASLVAQLVKNQPAMGGDLGSIHGLRRSPGERKGYPLQYSDLENSMDCIVHGVAKSRTQLSDFHFHVP